MNSLKSRRRLSSKRRTDWLLVKVGEKKCGLFIKDNCKYLQPLRQVRWYAKMISSVFEQKIQWANQMAIKSLNILRYCQSGVAIIHWKIPSSLRFSGAQIKPTALIWTCSDTKSALYQSSKRWSTWNCP